MQMTRLRAVLLSWWNSNSIWAQIWKFQMIIIIRKCHALSLEIDAQHNILNRGISPFRNRIVLVLTKYINRISNYFSNRFFYFKCFLTIVPIVLKFDHGNQRCTSMIVNSFCLWCVINSCFCHPSRPSLAHFHSSTKLCQTWNILQSPEHTIYIRFLYNQKASTRVLSLAERT